jgi:DNA end-binding protein Ku
MLALAEHIIATKKGTFDPSKYEDRYEAALADLVKAKLRGQKIATRKEPRRAKAIDLLAALRESAGMARRKASARSGRKPRRATKVKAAAPRRKAS